ncbi:MAG: hypothetical protein V3T23_03430 [Nitrososphaerales archaeon]
MQQAKGMEHSAKNRRQRAGSSWQRAKSRNEDGGPETEDGKAAVIGLPSSVIGQCSKGQSAKSIALRAES